jgi:hypothetical protein
MLLSSFFTREFAIPMTVFLLIPWTGLAYPAAPTSVNPLSVQANQASLSVFLPEVDRVRIAFIDISRQGRPAVTLTNLKGEQISSFLLPLNSHDPEWVQWGAGIQFDTVASVIWVLFPQVGYSGFSLNGDFVASVLHPRASHQIQILSNGNFVSPFSWDTPTDPQVIEISRKNTILWQWHAREFVETLDALQSPALRQPQSYTAAVSAVKTSLGHYWVALAQRNVIVKLDSTGTVLESRIVRERPHTLVVEGEDLVGYTLRAPNRMVIHNSKCNCMREHVLYEALPGKRSTRSLSLQRVAQGLWFISAVSGLYLMTEDGDIVWRLRHSGLNGRPQGFHSAVFFIQ